MVSWVGRVRGLPVGGSDEHIFLLGVRSIAFQHQQSCMYKWCHPFFNPAHGAK